MLKKLTQKNKSRLSLVLIDQNAIVYPQSISRYTINKGRWTYQPINRIPTFIKDLTAYSVFVLVPSPFIPGKWTALDS